MKRNMKNYIVAALCLLIASCTDSLNTDDMIVSREMVSTQAEVTLNGEELDENTLEITANCDWTISGLPSWLKVDRSEGSGCMSVVLSTKEVNDSAHKERTDSLFLTTKSGLKRTIHVTQLKGKERLEVNKKSSETLVFDYKEGNQSFFITSNTKWKIDYSNNIGLEVNPSEGTGDKEVTVSVGDNSGENSVERKVKISVTGDKRTQLSVEVNQNSEKSELNITPKSFDAPDVGTKYILKITGNATWTAEVEGSWIKLNPDNGKGKEDLEVTVEANASGEVREGKIIFNKADSLTCVITQAGGKLPNVSEVIFRDIKSTFITVEAQFNSESKVTECGFYYSEKPNPTGEDGKKIGKIENVEEENGTFSGKFSGTIDGLKPGTTYYVRAYVVNNNGTGSSGWDRTVITPENKPSVDDNQVPGFQ